MKVLFALYKYFPYGGLQRDMLAIARECASRGHQVSIFCQSWHGEYPEATNIDVNVLVDKKHWWMSRANHQKNMRFITALNIAINRIKPDRVIGFDRIPGVDVYYAADTSFKAKLYRERPWLYRCLPRYRHFMNIETALFQQESPSHILAISQTALEEYRALYQTPIERFTLLAPGVSRDRINHSGERLWLLHEELQLDKDKKIILAVGSGFRTKGLDRSINALAALPGSLRQKTHLVVVGEDSSDAFVEQAKQLGLAGNVHFLGGRKDVPQLLKSADLLMHPAYRENTGTVLLEAAISGLPVITTPVCGYATYIRENNLGIVLQEHFQPAELNEALATALTNDQKQRDWRNNGLQFAQRADIYDMPKRAADLIERMEKHPRSQT